jgi:hypothetical protein
MVVAGPKRPPTATQQKFVRKMDSIPSVALPEEETCKAALNLAERGLIGQFTGLWPSPKSVEEWTQRNWKPLIKEGVKSFFVGKGFFEKILWPTYCKESTIPRGKESTISRVIQGASHEFLCKQISH